MSLGFSLGILHATKSVTFVGESNREMKYRDLPDGSVGERRQMSCRSYPNNK
jgi:hypothetical protein